MTKEKLEIYTAFTILCRRAVDRLRQEYYGGNSYPGPSSNLWEALVSLRSEALPIALRDKDGEFFDTVLNLSEALFEQLMLSHRMMEYMYQGQSGHFLHSHLLRESCDRAEVLLTKVLDLGMQAVLGTKPGHLRA